MSNKRVRLIVEGRVQGVWYRDTTRRKAREEQPIGAREDGAGQKPGADVEAVILAS